MRFLEKNLEDIIFNNREQCKKRGLKLYLDEDFAYRQFNLMPFGIADIVHFGHNRITGELFARVIECKRDVVDMDTYTQACRYQNALELAGLGDIKVEKVLIGQRVKATEDFWHAVSVDNGCSIFTYRYEADGIHFEQQLPWEVMDLFVDINNKAFPMLKEWAQEITFTVARDYFYANLNK